MKLSLFKQIFQNFQQIFLKISSEKCRRKKIKIKIHPGSTHDICLRSVRMELILFSPYKNGPTKFMICHSYKLLPNYT